MCPTEEARGFSELRHGVVAPTARRVLATRRGPARGDLWLWAGQGKAPLRSGHQRGWSQGRGRLSPEGLWPDGAGADHQSEGPTLRSGPASAVPRAVSVPQVLCWKRRWTWTSVDWG